MGKEQNEQSLVHNIAELILNLKECENIAEIKYITGVSLIDDLAAKIICKKLNLNHIKIENLYMYPIRNVLVISENSKNLKIYKKYGCVVMCIK